MSDKSISKFNKEEILARITDWFSDSVSWDKKWRDNAKIWYEYYHGIQWSAEEVSALRDRGQAVSTYNFIYWHKSITTIRLNNSKHSSISIKLRY